MMAASHPHRDQDVRRIDRLRKELGFTVRALAVTMREHAKQLRRSASSSREPSRRQCFVEEAAKADERAATLERYALELAERLPHEDVSEHVA
jgi:hypothetical protein